MRAAVLALAALAVAACGTAPKAPPGKKPSYYADDGPPETVPADLAALPDAVPRDEPYHRYANRPYTVFGRTYAPVVNDDPVRERGLASWYGRKFHGQKTAIGEVYDMFAMTAAHKTLPLPSYARVTNLKSGQSVVVRVNDRGPFHDGRVIDLSYAAAARLGIAGPGSGLVEVERVFARDAERLARAPAGAATATPATAPAPGLAVGETITALSAATVATPLRPVEAAAAVAAPPAPAGLPPVRFREVAQARPVEPAPPRPAEVATPLVAREAAGLYLQLGAFSSAENAEGFRARLVRELPWLYEPLQLAALGGLHRVRLGPYKTREEAQAIADKIRATLDLAPVITPASR